MSAQKQEISHHIDTLVQPLGIPDKTLLCQGSTSVQGDSPSTMKPLPSSRRWIVSRLDKLDL